MTVLLVLKIQLVYLGIVNKLTLCTVNKILFDQSLPFVRETTILETKQAQATGQQPELFVNSRDRREYQYCIEKADTKPFGVSIGLNQGFFEYRYQSRYQSIGLCIFCKVLAELLSSKVPVSVSVPGHFPGISISINLN